MTGEITTINSIDDIEDFEFKKECRFFFYKGGGGRFDQKDIKGARGVATGTNNNQIVQKVNENKTKCAKNSFVYITLP